MEERRAKRRCARNKYITASMPSAIHYVGYVEDDETPEMIMAKFAELERIKAAAEQTKAVQGTTAAIHGSDASRAGDAALTSAQQEQQQQLPEQQQQPTNRGEPQQQRCEQQAGNESQFKASGEAGQEPAEEGLTEEQLLEVFKQTSMFNVRTALQDNEMLLGIDEILDATTERYADDEAASDDDMLRTFWSDEDEDVLLSDGDEDVAGARRSRRRGGSIGRMSRQGSGMGRTLQRNTACLKARQNVITAFNPITQALVRRKVRLGSERDGIVQLRLPPPPIPVSWGRTVQPYLPQDRRGNRPMAVPVPAALLKAMEGGRAVDIAAMERCIYREERSIPLADWAGLLAAGGYQAMLINPGWECEGHGNVAVQRLAKLPMTQLVPKGFVFIFVKKQHVQAVCRQVGNLCLDAVYKNVTNPTPKLEMRAWGYCYIENLTWVYLCANNQILELPSKYVKSSHLTLFMFRREGEGKDIELRHQRNPDVTFDCLATADGTQLAVPEETFVAIETLLPTGKGQFLELWAPCGIQRPGWTHIVELGTREQ